MTVHLFVPHYNAPAQLDMFLTRAQTLGFDGITVLDDASDDQRALERVAQRYPDVGVVRGQTNVGAGANRNRAMRCGASEVMVFIDCDTEIITDDIVDIVRSLYGESQCYLVGGLILNKSGRPMTWNYGHEMHPVRDARFEDLSRQLQMREWEAAWQRLGELGMDYAWLRDEMKPVRREVDWVAEGCFAIRRDDFERVGGYDEALRYHEGQDLAHRLRADGVDVIFEPRLVVRHLEIDVRHDARTDERRESTLRFYEKHWGMSRDVFHRLFQEGE